jgi:hypothetical protein
LFSNLSFAGLSSPIQNMHVCMTSVGWGSSAARPATAPQAPCPPRTLIA